MHACPHFALAALVRVACAYVNQCRSIITGAMLPLLLLLEELCIHLLLLPHDPVAESFNALAEQIHNDLPELSQTDLTRQVQL